MSQLAKSFRELEVYQLAFKFQQEVFERSKKWPKEGKWSQANFLCFSSVPPSGA